MRKLVIAGLVAAVTVLGAGVAVAAESWPSVSLSPTISPNKAGTPAHPQGVKLTTQIHWQSLGASNQPIVTHFLVLFPKGSLYNGSHYAKCSEGKLNSLGPSGCPRASIMGSGTGNAYADTVITHPQITVVNGGGSIIYFYTVLNNPARVQEPVVGHISKSSGKWAYSLNVSVPQNLQVVAGVPIELTYLKVSVGKGAYLATTRCSGGHWPFQITTKYLDPNNSATGSSTFASKAHCRG